ncbi:MAG: WecB/TagA/CpsF family glycosyltransferase [Limnobacter sp.]|uniref:WecB/TagA/CpsF family glycosyltransferase n=1 Tax=Limnobacter sp. TaxID=2003368 RepID=UPI00391BF3EA
MNIPKHVLFDVAFSAVTQRQAVHHIVSWLKAPADVPHLVVTPNVHFAVMQRKNPDFRRLLNSASLCVVDGRPILWASRWLGVPLPEVVTGSDLVPAILAACANKPDNAPLKVFLLGAAPGVAAKAAERIEQQYPGVEVSGHYSPPFGFELNEAECTDICRRVRDSGAELLVLGLGAPKQEFWAQRHLLATGVKVAVCAGATIDFMAGVKPRAPQWMQQAGLEWLFRVFSEPRRLAKRYINDGLALPRLLWAEYWKLRRIRQQ